MTISNETRAHCASMAVTMHALKKEGHNNYDTRINMTLDMMVNACHLLRREGADPHDVVRTMLTHFRAEEAEEQKPTYRPEMA